MKSNEFWIIVLGIAAIVSIISALLVGRIQGNTAHIVSNGTLIETVNLSGITEPHIINIESDTGGANTVEVEPGRIRVSKADCPDGTCIRQGWVSGGAMPIVCLPHSLVITIDSDYPGSTADIDAVAG